MSTTIKPVTALFESVTCGRCGGSGHYSYCQRFGSTCFKCHGRGWVLTVRGKVAQQFYTDLLSKPAADVAVGDVVRLSSITMGGDTYIAWFKVSEVARDGDHIKLVSPSHGGLSALEPADKKLRMAAAVEVKQAAAAKALAYQATLTQKGTVRKTRARAAEAVS